MREAISFCRICSGLCGVRLTIDDNERIISVRGDKRHPMSEGYVCIKGRVADVENHDARILHPLKRKSDGSFVRISRETALDEIANRISDLIATHGPDSMACYRGTANYFHTSAYHMLPAWMNAIGSSSFFSSLTIDQSAKIVTAERLGFWAAGRPHFEDADLWMFVGSNMPVSLGLVLGYFPTNPAKQLKEARARGTKFIVIDPRRTEMASLADLHIQPRPGEDPTIAACLIHVVLANGWQDQEFCANHTSGLEALRQAVALFTPGYASRRAGVPADQLYQAAEMFATASRNGVAKTGTGPDMAGRSNLSEHLYECLNVLCGRYLKQGDPVWSHLPLGPQTPVRAEVIAPRRSWESGRKSRVRNNGRILGEMLSGAMADEILTPGEGQIRGMIVAAGNPVAALPDLEKTVAAFNALELLVSIEPYMTATSRLAHYILPPTTQYEHPDLTHALAMPYARPFAQYTPAVVPPPEGSELVEDWYPFWGIAKRLNRQLVYSGVPLNMDHPPTTDELMDIAARHAQVDVEELKGKPWGQTYTFSARVQAGQSDARFEVAPEDIVAELREVSAESDIASLKDRRFTHRLISRRMRSVMNSAYQELPTIRKRLPYNPAYLNQDDFDDLGIVQGDTIRIVSEHGAINAIAKLDDTVRSGVVSMTHCWGGLPEDYPGKTATGTSTNLLVSSERNIEPINNMPRYSAIPVYLEKPAGVSD
jgi:anaerobic selenocysteine-containing dehydrogenase